MAEKTKLIKAFKNIETSMEAQNEKEKLMESFKTSNPLENEAHKLLKDKVKNLKIKWALILFKIKISD